MKRKRSGGGRAGGRNGSERRRSRHRGIRRSHFDSSSESSDEGGGFADHDQGFDRYQRKTHERELGSIQPINSFGPTPAGGGGGGAAGGGSSGSIVDKASARDLLRADVSPMEIDPSITFDSIGGGKVGTAVCRLKGARGMEVGGDGGVGGGVLLQICTVRYVHPGVVCRVFFCDSEASSTAGRSPEGPRCAHGSITCPPTRKVCQVTPFLPPPRDVLSRMERPPPAAIPVPPAHPPIAENAFFRSTCGC